MMMMNNPMWLPKPVEVLGTEKPLKNYQRIHWATNVMFLSTIACLCFTAAISIVILGLLSQVFNDLATTQAPTRSTIMTTSTTTATVVAASILPG